MARRIEKSLNNTLIDQYTSGKFTKYTAKALSADWTIAYKMVEDGETIMALIRLEMDKRYSAEYEE